MKETVRIVALLDRVVIAMRDHGPDSIEADRASETVADALALARATMTPAEYKQLNDEAGAHGDEEHVARRIGEP
jgi:hypothetical protein